MTTVNASNATEAVNILGGGNQIDFQSRDLGNNGTTSYSWLSTGGDDIQAYGSGMDYNGNPANYGWVSRIDIDLSNNNFGTPDVTFTNIFGALGGGPLSTLLTARLGLITDGSTAFHTEVLSFADTMTGSRYNDTFKAGGGGDLLFMGDGADTAWGDAGADTLYGGNGNDSLWGGADNDTIWGEAGNDTLDGGAGLNNLYGGAGDDTYYYNDENKNVINKSNIVEYQSNGTDLVIINSAYYSMPDNIENAKYTGTYEIIGNNLDNIIDAAGSQKGFTIFGGDGDDTLIAGDAGGYLHGNNGTDVLIGGIGQDYFVIDDVVDSIINAGNNTGQSGGDVIYTSINYTLSDSIDIIRSYPGTKIYGNSHDNIMISEEGDTLMDGRSGNDILYSSLLIYFDKEDSPDTLCGGLGADTLVGSYGKETFDFNATAESGPISTQRDLITHEYTNNSFDAPGGAPGDRIDLRTIDANTTLLGNQNFTFLGAASGSTTPGTVYLKNDPGTRDTIVYANTDRDAAPEMSIRINDHDYNVNIDNYDYDAIYSDILASAYSAADFIL